MRGHFAAASGRRQPSGVRERLPDLPDFFGPIATGEWRGSDRLVVLRSSSCQREPAAPASAHRQSAGKMFRFELRWRQIPETGVRPDLVVMLPPLLDARPSRPCDCGTTAARDAGRAASR